MLKISHIGFSSTTPFKVYDALLYCTCSLKALAWVEWWAGGLCGSFVLSPAVRGAAVRVLSCRAERWVGRFERVPSCTTVPCCLQLQADHHPLMPDPPGGKTTQPQLALHHDTIMIGTPQLALSHDVWVSALLPVATFVWIWGQKKRKHYDDVCTKNKYTRQGVFSWFYSVLF